MIEEDKDYFVIQMLEYARQIGMQANLTITAIFKQTCIEVWEDTYHRRRLPEDIGARFIELFQHMLQTHGREIPPPELMILKFIQGMKAADKGALTGATTEERIRLRMGGKEGAL